jgi:hypothetical protein
LAVAARSAEKFSASPHSASTAQATITSISPSQGPIAGGTQLISAEGQFINISSRVSVGTDTNVGIAGFILRSDTSPAPSKQVVVRGIGPSLTSRGVSGALQDPIIELRDSNGGLIASNDNWMDAANANDLQATGLAPTDPREAAILITLSSSTTPGSTNYTAILAGKNNTTGVGLVEVYDLDSTSPTWSTFPLALSF